MLKKKLLIAALLVVAGLAGLKVYADHNAKKATNMTGMNMSASQSQPGYRLDLMSGATYSASQPTTLHFSILNQNGKVFKNFAVDSTKLMHLVVVRSDRSNFQHVHPAYDSQSGMFLMENFQFPTDGKYRVFANFAPIGAKKDALGMVETEAPYKDVVVGNASNVTSQPLGADSLTSSLNGLTASIVNPPSDDSPGSNTSPPMFYAGQDGNLVVSVTQNGLPFKNLQEYLGNLGHMVILGPNMEFIHAHPVDNNINSQTGLILFMVKFPIRGQYKLYLQTQVYNQVSTFDFNLTVKDLPKTGSSGNNMSGMQNMKR